MNQAQRNYLVKRIETQAAAQTKAIESAKPEYPNLLNYLFRLIMSGETVIQPPEVIKKALENKALNANLNGYNWLIDDTRWGDLSSRNKVTLDVKDVIAVPPEYDEMVAEYRRQKKELEEMTHKIRTQAESLVTRIQLASDRTLQTMINEVDDLGDLSLYDDTLRKLMGRTGDGPKMLEDKE